MPTDFFGTKLALQNVNGEVTLWDVRTLAKLWSVRFPGKDGSPSDVHFTPDGRRLAMTVAYRRSPVFKEVVLDTADEVDFLAFSPDSKTLATVSPHGLLQLWDIEARRRLGGSYLLQEGQPWSLAFSADGATVYVGVDGAVRAVPVDGEREAQEVCARVGRSLSPAEWERYLGGASYQNVCP
ncbi:WD40 repeat domain-containing protein [Nonomuraea sp. NPDC050451]|uniref:WD40 repeat domain-containing protein n=1 Tax=Nonomuraea sp. NPDC050451 TaxID=3364364 RepID=UPI0037A74C2E